VENLLQLFVDAVDLVLDALAAIVDGILAVAELAIAGLRRLLEGNLHIPFLSSFYEFITWLLGDEEKLTVINGMALLVAIPAVTIARMAGKTLFDGAEDTMRDPQLLAKMTTPQPAPRAAAPARLAAAAAPGGPVATAADSGESTGTEIRHAYTRWGSAIGGTSGLVSAFCGTFAGEWPSAAHVGFAASLLRYAGTFPVTIPPGKTISWCLGVLFTIGDWIIANVPPPPEPAEAAAVEAEKAAARGMLSIMRGIAGFAGGIATDATMDPQPSWLVYSADVTSNVGAGLLGASIASPEGTSKGVLRILGLFSSISGALFAFSYAFIEAHPETAISNAGG
jgi:hypothetical protein